MSYLRNLIAATVAAVVLAIGALASAADLQRPAAGSAAGVEPGPGGTWPTDAPLRKYMAEIRAAVAAKQREIQDGTLTLADYQAIGTLVETRVANIVAECKLAPAADARLHLIVAELTAGADTMLERTEARPAKGAMRVVRAINDYGRQFNHPGWKPLK